MEQSQSKILQFTNIAYMKYILCLQNLSIFLKLLSCHRFLKSCIFFFFDNSLVH